MSKARVAVLKTEPVRVVEDYDRLADMAGLAEALDAEAPTIIKDNMTWPRLMPGANTPPWQLEGAVKALRTRGYDDLTVVQNDTMATNALDGERHNRYVGIFTRYGLPVLYTFRKNDIHWGPFRPRDKMLVLDKIYPDGLMIPEEFIGKNVVHLPTVKTHIYTTTTVSMKNAFGGLLNRNRHYAHSVIHEALVDLLRIQKEIHTGIFSFADGTTCGRGPGPRSLRPVEADYILASADCVALDAVSSRLMGFDPLKIGYIRIAHEQGLGVGDPREIEIIGEDISGINLHFTVGSNIASLIGSLFYFSPLNIFQKFLFHTPLIYLFVFGSSFYYDYLWYSFIGRRIVKRWRQTKWGRLFETY